MSLTHLQPHYGRTLFDAMQYLDEDPFKTHDVLRLFAGMLIIVAVFVLLVILLLATQR